MQSQLTSENVVYNQKNLEEIICQIDKGLLLGAPLPQNSTVLTKIASQVNAELFSELIFFLLVLIFLFKQQKNLKIIY